MDRIEIAFCLEPEGRIINVFSCAVPAEGNIVSIEKKDWVVSSVYWAIDYAADTLENRRLRATIELVEPPQQEEG